MSEPKLINLGRAVIDTNGVIAIFKNRETATLLSRFLRSIGIRREHVYQIYVDYAEKSEIGRTFSSYRITITYETREARDAAFAKLTAAVLGTDQGQPERSTLADAMERLNERLNPAKTGHTSQAEAVEAESAPAA